MNKPIKLFAQTVGLIVALMAIGMLTSAVFKIKPDQIKSIDLIHQFQWYRFGFYLLIIATWPWICRLMARSQINMNKLSADEIKTLEEKRQDDLVLLRSKQKHIALLIIFFEMVVIRQFGL
jgi:hypothetical protein